MNERQLIRHAIEHGELERLPEIIAIVRQTGALQPRGSRAR
jgi:octaprenyl-diphosphate synthase